MCRGHEKYHTQCDHVHSFFITAQCENARAAGRDCARDQCSSVERMMVSPPICPNCYRLEEKDICEGADKERNEIQEGLENVKRALENPNLTPRERSKVEEKIQRGTNLLNENRRVRALTLKAFRDFQGVWGDG